MKLFCDLIFHIFSVNFIVGVVLHWTNLWLLKNKNLCKCDLFLMGGVVYWFLCVNNIVFWRLTLLFHCLISITFIFLYISSHRIGSLWNPNSHNDKIRNILFVKICWLVTQNQLKTNIDYQILLTYYYSSQSYINVLILDAL